MGYVSAYHPHISWSLVFGLVLMLAPLLAGCGPDDQSHLFGDGEFELTGEADEELACEVRWIPGDMSTRGGNGDRQFETPGIYCGESGEPDFTVKLVLWERDDTSFPEASEGTYSTVINEIDCPVDGPPCAVGYMNHGDDSYFTLPDEGEFTINERGKNYITGELDLLLGNNFGEDPDKTIRLTGTFEASRR